MKLNPDMMPVMVAALEAGDMTSAELTDFVEGKILPELESIEGVASVTCLLYTSHIRRGSSEWQTG